jgi:hypothetical protein
MEHLFRLVLTRPAVAQDGNKPSVRLAQNSQFQAALGQAQQSRTRREAMKAVHDQLKTLDVAFDAVEKKQAVTNALGERLIG